MSPNVIAALILATTQQPIDQGSVLRSGQDAVPRYQPRQEAVPEQNSAPNERPDNNIAAVVDTCLIILPSRPDRGREIERMRRAWRGTRLEWEYFLRDCDVVAETVAVIRERLLPAGE